MRFPWRLLSAICVSALASCGGNEEREETWTVNSNLAVCSSEFVRTCYMVKRPTDADWQYEYAGIRGFHYEWGNVYTLKVGIADNDSSAEDELPIRVHLRSVLSKTPVAPATTFQLIVRPAAYALERKASDRFTVAGQELACQPADCAALDGLIADGSDAVLEFDHANSPAGPLHMLRVVCAAPVMDFVEERL
jgi:hypothetical protein